MSRRAAPSHRRAPEPRDRRDRRRRNARRGAPRRRHRRWPIVVLVVLVVVGLFGVGGGYAWNAFQPGIAGLFGAHQESDDYSGSGTGSVTIVIEHGDTGADIAKTLHDKGVTKSTDAFYQLLLSKPSTPDFQPGSYRLKKHMSAQAALTALLDPDNNVTRTAVIPEGTTEETALTIVAKATGLDRAQLVAAAKDVSSFGLPAQATSLEGFLFPAKYTFDPGISAHDALARMVARTMSALDDDGVPEARRWNTVVLASIVQREAGADTDDYGKIARVFDNRIAAGMPLQSDATVSYGDHSTGTVWTTAAQRENAANAYNTYVHKGLPPGPIGNPGDIAITAALNPTPGPWLYFVAVNLKTGQTVFSTTYAEHEKAVAQLQRWCKEPGNADYCS